MSANIIFEHPKMPNPLGVHINPNQIEWSYGLNTANFPTYGGEVIQILSAYIEDMTIQGNVKTYHKLEEIYSWFITYIQIATVGIGTGKFNVNPVKMFYRDRGWEFNIYPKTVPGFRYGTEVVAPEWTVTAAVVDPAQDLQNIILSKAQVNAVNQQGEVELFGKATGEIGFEEHNPFSDPEGEEGKRGERNRKKLLKGEPVKGGFTELADSYNKLLPAYLHDNFSNLTGNFSKPVVKQLNKEAEQKGNTKGKAKNG